MSNFGERNQTLIPPGMGTLDIFDLPTGGGVEGADRVVVLSQAPKVRAKAEVLDDTLDEVPGDGSAPPTPSPDEVREVSAQMTERIANALADDGSLAPATPSVMDWRPQITEQPYDDREYRIEVRVEHVAFAAGFIAMVSAGIWLIFSLV
jgi:hypothetical protein